MAALFFSGVLALPAAAADWPTYHRSNLRDGTDTSASPFSAMGQQWISPTLDGHVYAEPLVVGSQVIVATENNSIYSLDTTTGSPTWAAPAHVGAPVTLVNPPFPCGNINPLGITGTPVVDPIAGVIYAVAFVSPSDTYELVAYNLSNGTQKFAPIPIAPTGFDVHLQQQRGALALANGYVYVPFGGYIGDCGNYHGWVVGVKADGTSTALSVFQDQAQAVCSSAVNPREAGIWGTSGAAVDAAGNVYVATGNGADNTTYDCGETVFKLNSTLGYVDSWAPSVWASLNATDTDVGSIGPAIVGTIGNLVFQTGKNGWGYLLNGANLSGNANHIGAEAFSGQVCNAATNQTVANDQVFGGLAYADPFIYVPCPEGIKALRLAAGPSFSIGWSSQTFHPGPPIVSGGVVWAVDTNTNTLYGFDATTGAFRFSTSVGSQTHFSTPAAGQNRIFLADGPADVIRAFGQSAGRYHPLAPSRIYDSRGGPGPLAPNTTRDIQVTGLGGVPMTGVSAVVMNVTVTNTTSPSYLTVFPTGFTRPLASNLNWTAGKTVANLVEVAVGDAGMDTVYNAFGNTDVVVDVGGWVSIPGGTATPDGLYNALVPARILDTRTGTGGFNTPIGPGQTIDVQVTTQGMVPASGVAAAVFNVTATNSTTGGYLTLFPTGGTPPLASNVNFVANESVPNRAAVILGTGGKVSIYNPSGTVHVILDVNGWFTDATTGGTGSLFTAVTPNRILDTRNGTGGVTVQLGPNQSIAVQVAGKGGVPTMASSMPPKAVVLNVTAVSPTGAGYLTVWPDAVTRPGTSDLNFVAGQTVPNLVVVQVGTTGKIDVYNAFGSTDVVIDVMGWYG